MVNRGYIIGYLSKNIVQFRKQRKVLLLEKKLNILIALLSINNDSFACRWNLMGSTGMVLIDKDRDRRDRDRRDRDRDRDRDKDRDKDKDK